MDDLKAAGFYLAQMLLFAATILLYMRLYPNVSRLVVNNMCMLLCVGLIMLTRLSYEKALKQFLIASGAIGISLAIPIIIRRVKLLSEWRLFYAVGGLISLGVVAVMGQVSYGAKLGFTIAGISIQPSELVKIVFVFYVAASFKVSRSFKNVVITTVIAAVHVLILVASTDLGAALIIFVVYLTMLYVAARQPFYMAAGLAAGSAASVAAYHMFGHVRTRVLAWKDPFAAYDNGGYQVALGLGTCYIFQVFLTIGGVTKFIPSTGVTLPLVSYGGSSLLSTLIMFAIIQGLYILREDEEEKIERKKREQQQLRIEKRKKAEQQLRAERSGREKPEKNPAKAVKPESSEALKKTRVPQGKEKARRQ